MGYTHIQQNVLQHTNSFSSSNVFKLLISVVATIATIQLITTVLAPSTHAAIAPESCYNFDASTGTIVNYSNDPACPKEVEIPDAINGVSVTTIGDSAFSYDLNTYEQFQLTAVTISNSVTSIGDSAFYNNQLTSVTIPASVTNIGSYSFGENKLSTVYIEGNPTLGDDAFAGNGRQYETVPYLYGSPEYAAYVLENTDLVRVYASDPLFYAAYPSGFKVMSAVNPCSPDEPDTCLPPFGHHIISAFITNPVSLTVNFQNSQGSTLAPSAIFTGFNDSTPFSGYRLSNAPVDYSTPSSPTIDLSVFSMQGAVVSPEVLAIAGYIAPSGRTITLSPGANTLTYIYLTQAEIDAGTALNPDGTPNVPNTGLRSVAQNPLLIASLGLVAAATLGIVARRSLVRHNNS